MMTRSYSTYERELNAAGDRRDSDRRGGGEAGDYYRSAHDDVRADRTEAQSRAAEEDAAAREWAQGQPPIPEWVSLGEHVLAYDLKHIAERCGVNVAASVDALCRPCEECAINTYGGGVCSQCIAAEELYTSRSNRDPEVTAELAGAFTPRCDF